MLLPINAEYGGKPVRGTVFTTNGFIKRKVDHANLELQTAQLSQMFYKTRIQAEQVVESGRSIQFTANSSSNDDRRCSLIRQKKVRREESKPGKPPI